MGWGVLRVERKGNTTTFPPLARMSGNTNFSNASTAVQPNVSARRASAISPQKRQQLTNTTTPLRRMATISAGLLATAPHAGPRAAIHTPEAEATTSTQTPVETRSAMATNAQIEPSSAPPVVQTATTIAPQMINPYLAVPGAPMAPPTYTPPFPPYYQDPSYAVQPMQPMHPMHPMQYPGMHPYAAAQVGGFPGFPGYGYPHMNPYAPLYNPGAFQYHEDPGKNMYYPYLATQASAQKSTDHPVIVDGTSTRGIASPASTGVAVKNGEAPETPTGSPRVEITESQAANRAQGLSSSGKSVTFSSPLVNQAYSATSHD
jgi:hypothetical protein